MRTKKAFLVIVLIGVAVLFIFGNSVAAVRANNIRVATITGTPTSEVSHFELNDSPEFKEIEDVIYDYFEIRYLAFSNLQLDDFRRIVSRKSNAQTFLDTELGKLSVEIKHAELNHLKYMDSQYFLDLRDITVDASSQEATVIVTESHDVIFEISKKFNPENPIRSHMYNLEHTIVLNKEQDQWKIVSDGYEDDLWRIIRQTGMSTENMLHAMEESSSPMQPSADIQTDPLCTLDADDSIHAYDRDGAVQYAHDYANSRNPNYYDFTEDCANFVSQAVYEGGNASMAYCEPNVDPYCPENGGSTSGWYYTDINHRAFAWSGVSELYDFILDSGNDWDEGPEGCEVSQNQAEPGDIIKYDWENDGEWDHAVIIVQSEDDEQGNRMHWIASHTDDHDNYPFTYYNIHPDMIYRFVHIERINISASRGFNTDGILLQ